MTKIYLNPKTFNLKPGMLIMSRHTQRTLLIVSMVKEADKTYTIRYLTAGSKKIEHWYGEAGYLWSSGFKVLSDA